MQPLLQWSPLTFYSNFLADFQSGPAPLELEDAWGDSLDQEGNESTLIATTVASPALAPVAHAAESPRPPPNGFPQHQPIKLQNSAMAQRKSPPVPVHTPSAAPSQPVAIPGNWDDDFDDSSSSPARARSSVVGSMAGMTKEEKAAEMARRREERKQVCKFMLRGLDVAFNLFPTNVAHCCTEGAEKGGRKVAA
jgi:SCY1-like protein 1